MTRRLIWTVTAGLTSLLGTVIAGLAFIPQLLYPQLTDAQLQTVSTADVRIQLQQAQSQLQNNARSTLLQAVAGLLVVAGAIVTWQQVQVNRDGHITERFTRAVDQVGSDNIDVRIGGIYALERIAQNSSQDRNTILYILGAFVRTHMPWPPVDSPNEQVHPTEAVDEQLPWMRVRAPDIQAAMGVMGRRRPSRDEQVIYLSHVDLRSLAIRGSQLAGAKFRYANLARAVLAGVNLNHADLTAADLRRAFLEHAKLADATLNRTYLQGASLRQSNLSRADLRGANLTDAILDSANLTDARADHSTIWPDEFDIEKRRTLGVIDEEG